MRSVPETTATATQEHDAFFAAQRYPSLTVRQKGRRMAKILVLCTVSRIGHAMYPRITSFRAATECVNFGLALPRQDAAARSR